MIEQTNPGLTRTLGAIVEHLPRLQTVRKLDLEPGDSLSVRTRNSTYSIRVLGGNLYSISGGWFDQQGLSPFETSIAGCTWGGRAIQPDLVAACGLHLEFGNQVITSAIQEVKVVRLQGDPWIN